MWHEQEPIPDMNGTRDAGNHDMEGSQFDTDEENLTAWQQCFKQHHCWVRDAGPAVLVGMHSYVSSEHAHAPTRLAR
jgi:hypothetical protein